MKKKPLIGLTLDLENNKSYSKFPWYAIRQNYCSAISNMGGIPIPLVYDINSINTMVEKLDGFIITGGAFDINPSYFSEKKKFKTVVTKEDRTEYEIRLCNKVLKKNLPLLGICGGQQLINVVYGGSLIQDINKEVDTNIKHEQPNPRNQTSHTVNIKKNTLKAFFFGTFLLLEFSLLDNNNSINTTISYYLLYQNTSYNNYIFKHYSKVLDTSILY